MPSTTCETTQSNSPRSSAKDEKRGRRDKATGMCPWYYVLSIEQHAHLL